MGAIILLCLILIIALAVVMYTGSRLFVSFGSQALERNNRNAQHIIETGSIPPEWRDGDEHTVSRRSVRRLRRLYRFYLRAPVFENDDARRLLLTRLAHALDRWESAR